MNFHKNASPRTIEAYLFDLLEAHSLCEDRNEQDALRDEIEYTWQALVELQGITTSCKRLARFFS